MKSDQRPTNGSQAELFAVDRDERTPLMTTALTLYLGDKFGVDPGEIDRDRPIFGTAGAAIGQRRLDSTELFEVMVELEGRLGTSLLDEFDAFDELSIARMAEVAATLASPSAVDALVKALA